MGGKLSPLECLLPDTVSYVCSLTADSPLTRARLLISLVPYLREGALQLPLELTPRLMLAVPLAHDAFSITWEAGGS